MSRKQGLFILVVVAVLTVLLFNMRTIIGMIEAMNFTGLDDREIEGRLYRARIASKDAIFQLVLFLALSFFNFWLKDLLTPKSVKRQYRTLVGILGNIFLLLILIRIDLVYEAKVDPSMTYVSLSDAFLYSLKHIAFIAIAILVSYFLLQLQRVKDAEDRLARSNEEKTKAELAALRSQINPHFFFNTLSSLSSVVRHASKNDSLDFIQELSNTYRYTLTSRKTNLVTLSEELAFAKSYAFLIKKRFEDSVKFEYDIPGAYTKWKVPPMAIQTLIENGVQHNIITKDHPLLFTLKIENDFLCVINTINKKEDSEGLGSGLSNLSNRFELIAGKQIVINQSDNEFIVRLPLI
ncbi:MAG: histidine kinase [Bacteroidota bacterium]|nr:histidine kinase [Bacteroidota bacterium]